MANGNFAGGDGSLENPYLIEDAHDLNAIREEVDSHYKLIKNINLDIAPYNEGEGWSPITNFNGSLDGSFYSINNLYINSFSKERLGLFGIVLSNGSIKNLRVLDVDVRAPNSERVGGVIATCFGECNNLLVSGDVSSNTRYTGGVIGNTETSVSNVVSYCNVSGTQSVGGVIGFVQTGATLKNAIHRDGLIKHIERNSGSVTGDGQGSRVNCLSLTSYAIEPITSAYYTVSSSFYDNETNTHNTVAGIGLTTLEAKTPQTYKDVGWDEETTEEGVPVWILEDGEYPKLWFELPLYKNNKYLLQNNKEIYKPTELGMEYIGEDKVTKEMFEEYPCEDIKCIYNNTPEYTKEINSEFVEGFYTTQETLGLKNLKRIGVSRQKKTPHFNENTQADEEKTPLLPTLSKDLREWVLIEESSFYELDVKYADKGIDWKLPIREFNADMGAYFEMRFEGENSRNTVNNSITEVYDVGGNIIGRIIFKHNRSGYISIDVEHHGVKRELYDYRIRQTHPIRVGIFVEKGIPKIKWEGRGRDGSIITLSFVEDFPDAVSYKITGSSYTSRAYINLGFHDEFEYYGFGIPEGFEPYDNQNAKPPLKFIGKNKEGDYLKLIDGGYQKIEEPSESIVEEFGVTNKDIEKYENYLKDVATGNLRLVTTEEFVYTLEGFTKDLVSVLPKGKILVLKDIEKEGVPIADIKAYSSPQLILANDNIRLEKVSAINSFTLHANDEKEKIRVIFSLDDGETWLSKIKKSETYRSREYINTEVDIANLEDIVEKGMTIRNFNDINSDWTEDIVRNGKIRFGYFLDIDDIGDISEIDKLEIEMDLYGHWESQRHEDTHAIGYSNDKIMVKILEGGTYKINYG